MENCRNRLLFYYNKIKNLDQSSMAIYFFLVSFSVAIILYSASIDIAQFKLLNPTAIKAINNLYQLLHIYIFLVLTFFLLSILFMFLKKKAGWSATLFFVLYTIYTLGIIVSGIWFYIIIPMGA
jgi:hypothetical protein